MIKTIDKAINNALLWATSTKQAFYALNVLIIIAVITSPPTTIQGWLLVIVSEYYQGIALPGLGSQTRVENERTREDNEVTRKLLQENHDMLIDELKMIKEEMAIMKEEREELRAVVTVLKLMIDDGK